MTDENAEARRRELEEHIAQYLAEGGKIEQLPPAGDGHRNFVWNEADQVLARRN